MVFLKSKRKTLDATSFNVKISSIVDTDDYVETVTKAGKMKNMMMMKKKGKSLNIFRRKSKADGHDSMHIQPGLTWTNSEDSYFSGDYSFASGSTREIQGNNTLILPFDETNATMKSNESTKELNYLVAKLKTEMEEKQVEIELMHDQIVVLNKKNMDQSTFIDLMKEQHELAIHEKIMETKSMQSRMDIMKSQHQEETEILETTIQEKDSEILDLKAQLNCTKDDLFEVSSNLIQTQHQLHELSSAWPYKFFLWRVKG